MASLRPHETFWNVSPYWAPYPHKREVTNAEAPRLLPARHRRDGPVEVPHGLLRLDRGDGLQPALARLRRLHHLPGHPGLLAEHGGPDPGDDLGKEAGVTSDRQQRDREQGTRSSVPCCLLGPAPQPFEDSP